MSLTKVCPSCNTENPIAACFCRHCGHEFSEESKNAAKKNKIIAALLAFFLGSFGIHRFYLGENRLGITYVLVSVVGYLFTIGIMNMIITIVTFVECIIFLAMNSEKFDRKYNKDIKPIINPSATTKKATHNKEQLTEFNILTDTKTCPMCQTENPIIANFCRHCCYEFSKKSKL